MNNLDKRLTFISCLLIQVEFSFNKDKGEPGEEVKYTLSAATDSLCGIGVIDRSLEILAGNSFIVKDKVCMMTC
jgi:hypothetical protein